MNDSIKTLIEQMPKVELHVHLEGSVAPKTLLKLSQKNNIDIPAKDLKGLEEWYTFRDFDHFIEVYRTISKCFRQADDIELITHEFLIEQARQNVVYTEVIFTPYHQYKNSGLGSHEQMDAVQRACTWGQKELGIQMSVIVDIPRSNPSQEGEKIAAWAIERYGDGLLVGFGLGGPEKGNPPEKFRTAFDKIRKKGIPCILHAGETQGPESVWQAINIAGSVRIGHGVRSLEDPEFVAYLRETQTPLEVCPTSNICLKLYPSLAEHCLPQLLDKGLYVTINSDDPPMFNTTLTNEFIQLEEQFNWRPDLLEALCFNALNASLLPVESKNAMREKFQTRFKKLRASLSL